MSLWLLSNRSVKIQMLEVDSVYHLSCDKNGVVFGAGITKGSEGTTAMGERIQAGKFPVLFYANNSKQSQIDKRSQKKNSRILRRVGVLLQKNSIKISCANQGNSKKSDKS
jgi:hypothetical protein